MFPTTHSGENLDVFQIQAIVFYSDQALELVGVSDAQMETTVSSAFADVNVGIANSEIGITFTIVYQGSVSHRM